MCGITGVIAHRGVNITLNVLKSMSDVIAHRGPDGEGQWLNKDHSVGLAHRRLAVLDLSDSGAQPMLSHSGRFTIIFNGEIYNYIELREKLIALNFKFRSASDTEVLLAMYEKYGVEMLSQLDGMFVFAIWDEHNKELFCARDRFGEKPFFYANREDVFVFGSEMKAIWEYGVPKQVSDEKRLLYVEKSVIRTEKTIDEPFFEEISILDAACYMFVRPNQKIEIETYWSLNDIEIDYSISFNEASKKFHDLFLESVQRRMRSDVPIGSSLSGGIDSSAIVCLVDAMKSEGQYQSTFTARFPGFNKDEGKFVDLVKERCPSVRPFEVFPQEKDLLSLLETAAWHHEEPIGSSSVLAQYEVYAKAKEQEVTVLLDGQGADEYLAGYVPIYNHYLKQLSEEDPWLYRKEYKAYTSMHDKLYHRAKIEGSDNSLKTRFREMLNHYRNNRLALPDGFYTLRDHLKLLTNKTTLKELLRYADRNSMAHSREVRLPFLSHKLVEFAHSLPDAYILKGGWTKYILRESMSYVLPYEIAWRIDKVGFQPHQDQWIQGSDIQEILNIQRKKYDLKVDRNLSYTNSSDWRLLADYFI